MAQPASPDWYWARGLHDAVILSRETAGEYLILHLDASGAMFDTSVKAIRFRHYRELTDNAELAGCWWVSDLLTKDGEKYTLEITCRNASRVFPCRIRFTECTIIR